MGPLLFARFLCRRNPGPIVGQLVEPGIDGVPVLGKGGDHPGGVYIVSAVDRWRQFRDDDGSKRDDMVVVFRMARVGIGGMVDLYIPVCFRCLLPCFCGGGGIYEVCNDSPCHCPGNIIVIINPERGPCKGCVLCLRGCRILPDQDRRRGIKRLVRVGE